MTLNERDRRILLALIPVVILIAYWFLLLSPKRSDLSDAKDQRAQAEQARDQAVAQAAQLQKARQSFAADYAEVVRLGKAIPVTVDSPSLLIQLDRAARGTHIDFDSVSFGARATATTPVATTTSTGPAQPGGNAAAGGAPAQTGAGGAVENAGNTVTNANTAATQAAGTDTTSTTTTTATGTNAPPSTTTTLDTVALTFNFTGSYFDLADFFHRLKRFVYVANNQTFVRGRLLSIDTLTFAPAAAEEGQTSRGLVATVGATVYLSPAGQGPTGGATAAGPAGTTTSTTTTTPAGSQTSAVPLATAGAAR